MSTDIENLWRLQASDDVVDAIMARQRAVEPRLRGLQEARDAAVRALNQAKGEVEDGGRRLREVEGRLADHRARQEKNVAHLDAVKKMRDATAASAQVEAGKAILLAEEEEHRDIVSALNAARQRLTALEAALSDLDAQQADDRQAIEAERAALADELATARARREEHARTVSRSILGKYERIRTRRGSHAVFHLAGVACGSCDTAIPVQRRPHMAIAGAIEVCEGCGVLLVATQ